MLRSKMTTPSNVVDFLLICGRLKTTKRTGWVNHNVKLPESISDHMHRMSLLSFLIVDNNIDKSRALKIACVHDLAEALVGDITPFDGVTKDQKRKLEHDAMEKIKNTVGGTIGEEIYQHWMEYENAETPEAKMVKDFDKFEMILQAYEYEKEQKINLEQFYTSTKGAFKTSLVQSWVTELESRRQLLNLKELEKKDEVKIRTQLKAGDLGNIISLHGKIYSQESGYPASFEVYVAQSLSVLKQSNGYDISPHRIWICESGNEMIGCIGILKHSDTQAQLRWLLLDKKFRGKGLGRNLVRKAIEYSRDELKVKELFLLTIKGLEVTKLYEAEGFKAESDYEVILWGDKRQEQRFVLTF